VVSEAEMLNDARDEVANDVTSPVVKAESEKTDAEPKLVESDKKTDHNTEKAKTGSGETGNENKKTLTVPSVAASDVVAGNLDIAADSDGLTTLLTKEKQKQDAQKDLAKGETIASNGKELEVAQSEANRKSKRNEEAERKRLTEEPQRAASISRIPAQETAYELAEEAVVDRTNAQFPGGDDKLRSFIARKKNYTNVMREQNLSGVIAVTFDVEADGRVSNARIKSGENGQFKADALRVVRSMPKWKPATVNDEPIKSMVTLELIYGEE
jgi:TonB family protein